MEMVGFELAFRDVGRGGGDGAVNGSFYSRIVLELESGTRGGMAFLKHSMKV